MRNCKSLPFLLCSVCTFFITCLLSIPVCVAQTIQCADLEVHGPKANRINFVYVSEGFKADQMSSFVTKAQAVNDFLFGDPRCSPFSDYRSFFNTYVVKVPSVEDGSTHPGSASDEYTSNGQPVQTRNTYFKGSFDVAAIHRLVTVQSEVQVLGVVGQQVPEYDQVVVLCNSPYYGGSGGTLATATDHASSVYIAQHELGHSFGGLADEYFQATWERPNMTQNNNPATVKWKNWLGIENIGIYPYGSSGAAATWYRPSQNCVMQYLGGSFCAVCREAITDRIHRDVSMIEGYTPSANAFTLLNTGPPFFTVSHLQTTGNTVQVKWYLNNSTDPVVVNQPYISIPFNKLRPGENIVRADVVDSSSLSKKYLPAVGYVNSIEWTITNPLALATELLDFSGRVADGTGIINWKTDQYDRTARFELEKSRDGVDFTLAATLKAEPDNEYTYTDADLYAPSTWYRLKIYTSDAPQYVSRMIRLQQPLSNMTYKVYQEPAGRYRVVCETGNNDHAGITVTDVNGVVLINKKLTVVNGRITYTVDLGSSAAGIYFLKIQAGNKVYATRLAHL